MGEHQCIIWGSSVWYGLPLSLNFGQMLEIGKFLFFDIKDYNVWVTSNLDTQLNNAQIALGTGNENCKDTYYQETLNG
ncbi:hypothetical protein RIR_jg8342.t1 [Rhizophagus irregularis DAOM 181602=DAOM 197198]|nr:hypothetical protein RIR_jg8342.t1 [Rhizophagus irregularis DAOM 181602=DAOM 197198]